MIKAFINLSNKILKFPIAILIFVGVVSIFFAYYMKDLRINNTVMGMISDKIPEKQSYLKYQDIFGSNAYIILGIESKNIFNKDILNLVREITERIEKLKVKIPKKRLSKQLKISEVQAMEVIRYINNTYFDVENDKSEQDDLKSVLSDPVKIAKEFSFDEKTAKRVSHRFKNFGLTYFLMLYKYPISSVMNILNLPYLYNNNGALITDTLLTKRSIDGEKSQEITQKKIKLLGERLDKWNFYDDQIVSKDRTFTTIIVRPKDYDDLELKSILDEEIHGIIRTLKPYKTPYKIYISGETIVSGMMGSIVRKDMSKLIPLVIIIVLIILSFSFRNIYGVIMPLIAVGMSSLWTMGLMAVLGYNLSVVSSIIPVILVAVGSAYGIHIVNQYYHEEGTNEERVKEIIEHVGIAVLMAAFTTIVGFFSLITSDVVPIREFGVFMAIGIFFAYIMAVFFVPALLLKLPLPKANMKEDKFFNFKEIADFTFNKKYGIIIVFAIFSIISIFSFSRIKVNINNIDFFKKSSDIRIAERIFSKKLSGTQDLTFIFKASKNNVKNIIDYDLFKKIDEFSIAVKNEFPKIGKIVSVVPYLKWLNYVDKGSGNKKDYIIPRDNELLRNYIELYSQGGALESVMNEKKDMTAITMRMEATDSKTIIELKKYILKYFSNIMNDKGYSIDYYGVANFYVVLNKLIVNGLVFSLLSSMLVVLIFNSLVFKSFIGGLFSVLPLLITLIIIFGVMGIFKIPLDMATSAVACIAIGIGVDYSIHFLTRFRTEYSKTGDMWKANENTMNEVGKAIIFNILAVMGGFLVLLFSSFVPIVNLGILIALTMVAAGVGSITLLPASLMIFKPKFISTGKDIGVKNV